MSILEDLWYGNVCPAKNSYDETKDYKELLNLYIRNWDRLVPTMNDEQKETLEKMQDIGQEMMQHAECRAFIAGFQVAVKVMIEAVQTDYINA